MDDVHEVHVLDCERDLVDDVGGVRLGEAARGLLFEEAVEVAEGRPLEHEVDSFVGLEEAVEGNDVGVSEVREDFDLAGEVGGELALAELFFAEDFEGEDVFGLFFADY